MKEPAVSKKQGEHAARASLAFLQNVPIFSASALFSNTGLVTSMDAHILHFAPAEPETRRSVPAGDGSQDTLYDPELLYVECRRCGHPILWEPGRTTALLLAGGIDPALLDERCLIVSDGCSSCRPGEMEGYGLAVIRIAGLEPDEAVYMMRPAGNA